MSTSQPNQITEAASHSDQTQDPKVKRPAEMTDTEWERACDQAWLSAWTQRMVPFNLAYAKDYKLVMPLRTMVPCICFFCHRRGDTDKGDRPVYHHGLSFEDRHDYPWTCWQYCESDYCKTCAKISEQLYLALEGLFFPISTSPLMSSNVVVRRTSGNLESDWKIRVFALQDDKIMVGLCKTDGTRRGVYLDEFMALNPELTANLETTQPVFDKWYPVEAQEKIMKVYQTYIKPAPPASS